MCGISALVSLKKGTLNPQLIQEMNALIRHRGPDDEGFLCVDEQFEKAIPFGGKDTPEEIYQASIPHVPHHSLQGIDSIGLLLGHRRLSIIDLSPQGHQPLKHEHEPLWITYNGEVFNYVEIRQELQALGYRFVTATDTEVILKAYLHWGTSCLNKFNGMFSFVIVDLKRKKVFAARDRFGVKPLYFWISPHGFLAFASEIKQFTCLPGWKAEVNREAAFHYLSYGVTDYSNESLFQGVRQLRGGQMIEGNLPLEKIPEPSIWYQLQKKPSTISFEEASSQFHFLFQDAVQLRLRSDVPIGSCLSGGLDSSSIVCMAHKQIQGGVSQKTFSACSHVARFDERQYMEEVILHTNVEAHFVYPTAEKLLDSMEDMIWHQDEPFGSTSIAAQYFVFQLAKQAGMKVMLDGQGADEKLGGYTSFWDAHYSELFRRGRLWQLTQEISKHGIGGNQINKKRWLSFSAFMIKQALPTPFKHFLRKLLQRDSSPLTWINLNQIPEKAIRHSFTDAVGQQLDHFVDKLSYEQLIYTSLPSLLRYEDRNSMAHSIEARTPFLDYRLVEFVFSLPAEYKISKGLTKRVLRSAMRGVIPEMIRQRKDKLGFATAEEVWMLKEEPDFFKKAIQEAIEQSQGLINKHAMIMADQIFAARLPFSWVLWRIINFGKWMDRFSVSL